MMTWIALLLIALALGAVAAVVSSRRVRTLRDELFEDALPSARTGDSADGILRPEPTDRQVESSTSGADWGLRWTEVTNLTPAGPDRRPAPSGVRTEEKTSVRP